MQNTVFQIPYGRQTISLVPMNKFWCDFGTHLLGDKKMAFLTENVAQPTSCFSEVSLKLVSFLLIFFCADDFGFGSFRFTIQCRGTKF